MPGEHVDKAFKKANDKLAYKGKTPEELKGLTSEEVELDKQLKRPEVGSEAFNELEKDATLTPEERQEVYQRLAKASTQREMDKTPEGQKNTLMRNATKNTNFMAAYLSKYAQDYNNAVLNEIQTETLKMKMPSDPGMSKRYPGVGETTEQAREVRPETLKQLDDLSLELGNKIVQAQNKHLAKLSPEARKFLEASMEPTLGEGESVTHVAMSSTLVLKNTSPLISNLGRDIGKDEQTKFHGKLLEQSNKLSQTFYNNTLKKPGEVLSRTKAQNRVAEKMLTEENLGETAQSFEALSEGGQKLTNLAARRDEMLLKEALKPFQTKITGLEKKLDGLKTPSFTDKMKAFFNSGFPPSVEKGLKKMKEDTITEIDNTKMAALQAAAPKEAEMMQKRERQAAADLRIEANKWDPGHMAGVLNLPTMNQAFQQFAKDNFSAENVNFHNDVAALKTMIKEGATVEEIRMAAKDIGDKYIGSDAPDQINLDSGTNREVVEALKGLEEMSPDEMGEMFDASDDMIVAMMENDSLGKFKNSAHYEAGLAKLTPGERQGIKEHGGKLQAEIGRLEKNVSVREKLGMQDKAKVQQQQKTTVGMRH